MTSDLSLPYLLAHAGTLRLAVASPAALLLLLCVPLLIVLARSGSGGQRLALGFRVAAFGCLVLALAGVAVSALLPNDRLSLIAAVDVSESIDAKGRQWAQRYLDHLAGALAPQDELGVVVFAAGTDVLQPPGLARHVDLRQVTLASSATDISQGIETAMALFAPDAQRRLVLISDGNETRGNSLAKIARARRAGVPIFPAVPPHRESADVALEKLVVAPLVTTDKVFPLHVVLRNTGKRRAATVSLLVDGETVGSQDLTLESGLNAVEIPYQFSAPGGHRLRAQVSTADDVIAGNDYRAVTVTVGGRMRVLMVSARQRSALARVLERKGFEVSEVAPGDLPERAEDLVSYHCVILDDVTARVLPAQGVAAVERYVRDFGGGSILAAGEGTYGDPELAGTALERMLPVTLEPRKPPRSKREPLALFVLIDRSNSMGYHIRNRLERSVQESKLAYAKRAASAVVNQLKDTDLVGLIAFDSQPFEVASLRPLADNRSTLEADIPRLQPGGGTDFYDALESARAQLARSRANARHVILLTDGDTNRGAADHYSLIGALVKADITVTTVRIGDDTVNLKLLHDISGQTGGHFHHVENAEQLPELLVKDTTQALPQPPPRPDTVAPQIAGPSQVLHGIHQKELPNLDGYAYAKLRLGADLLLYVSSQGRKDPLLGAWQYGLGRVTAFTASPAEDAETWTSWEGFGRFWSQLVHWTARDQTPWDYAVEAHRAAGQLTLTLRSFEDLDDGLLLARIFPDPDHAVDVPLTPGAPRQFTGRLPALPGGRYPLLITKRSGARDVTQRTEVIEVPDTDDQPQEEFATLRPNLPLLKELAAATGGEVDAPVGQIVERELGTKRVVYPLNWLFIPAAMLCFLADVGIRRLWRGNLPGF